MDTKKWKVEKDLLAEAYNSLYGEKKDKKELDEDDPKRDGPGYDPDGNPIDDRDDAEDNPGEGYVREEGDSNFLRDVLGYEPEDFEAEDPDQAAMDREEAKKKKKKKGKKDKSVKEEKVGGGEMGVANAASEGMGLELPIETDPTPAKIPQQQALLDELRAPSFDLEQLAADGRLGAYIKHLNTILQSAEEHLELLKPPELD